MSKRIGKQRDKHTHLPSLALPDSTTSHNTWYSKSSLWNRYSRVWVQRIKRDYRRDGTQANIRSGGYLRANWKLLGSIKLMLDITFFQDWKHICPRFNARSEVGSISKDKMFGISNLVLSGKTIWSKTTQQSARVCVLSKRCTWIWVWWALGTALIWTCHLIFTGLFPSQIERQQKWKEEQATGKRSTANMVILLRNFTARCLLA